MNKKAILGALALVMVFMSCQGYDKETDFKVSPANGGKSVEITEYIGAKQTVKIPPRIQKMPVTGIVNRAFRGKGVMSVTIPKSVTSIGDYTFQRCSSLTSITIPASVTVIGNGAFVDCRSLTSITVSANNPNYVNEAGIVYNKAKTEIVAVPQGISGKVTIPTGVTEIGFQAFAGCTSLTSITIPAGVTSIDHGAFEYCTSLTSITIPDSVTSIGSSAFNNCTSLTSVTFAAGSKLETIGKEAFLDCASLTSITIPVGVTEIDWYAFRDCTSLTNITIPASVTAVGNGAFANWTSSQTINILGHASQDSADSAWNVYNIGWNDYIWWDGCNATIVYQGGN